MTKRQSEQLETIKSLFTQQLFMYERRTHSVPDRIVSIAQPFVRPMVRGKASAKTEFGMKVAISTDDGGFARIERSSFDAFNESEGLIDAVESYREREGVYPDRILADKLYRTRANIRWCSERGIRLSGPRLGRPPSDAAIVREEKATERKDAADRNVVEGVFGTTKRTYGLSRVAARLEQTTKTVVSLAMLVFNLKKLLALSLCQYLDTLISWVMATIEAFDWMQKSVVLQN